MAFLHCKCEQTYADITALVQISKLLAELFQIHTPEMVFVPSLEMLDTDHWGKQEKRQKENKIKHLL